MCDYLCEYACMSMYVFLCLCMCFGYNTHFIYSYNVRLSRNIQYDARLSVCYSWWPEELNREESTVKKFSRASEQSD